MSYGFKILKMLFWLSKVLSAFLSVPWEKQLTVVFLSLFSVVISHYTLVLAERLWLGSQGWPLGLSGFTFKAGDHCGMY